MKHIGTFLALVFASMFLLAAPALAAPDANSGKGMNREGSLGVHPGKGWKDPGQVQGSLHNLADPDCNGNRTNSPQATNIGACDSFVPSSDKLAGTGGFDLDKDFNNGCGNDVDFEDDNNGRCGKSRSSIAPVNEEHQVPKQPLVLGTLITRTSSVLGEEIRPATLPQRIPGRTGMDATELLLDASALIATGRMLSKRKGRTRKRAGAFRLFSFCGICTMH